MLDKYANDIKVLRTWYQRAKEIAIKAESMLLIKHIYSLYMN